jgi:hypothetical protein
MRTVVILCLLALLGAVRTSHAGDCSNGGPDVIRQMEAYARGKTTRSPQPDNLCVEQGVMEDPKLVRRFLAACEKIVAKDADDMGCIRWSIEMGAKRLGTFDLFDGVSGFVIEPFEYGNVAANLLVQLDDPRAVKIVRDAWRTANADPRASSPKKRYAHNFTVFRHSAIKLIARHGGADDAAFLVEQNKLTRDRGLKRAIGRALAAIDKRAQGKASP